MFIIAVITQKGGSGKTTLSINLAAAAAEAGHTPLVIDCDMQASACKWADRREKDLAPHVIDAQPSRLAGAIKTAEEQGIDVIIIDTPPKSGEASAAAAKVADVVIIPFEPQILDLETIENTKDILQLAKNPPAIAVLNKVPPVGTRRQEDAAAFLRQYGLAICAQSVSRRAIFGDATAMGKSVIEAEPQGKAAQEIREVYLQVIRFSGKQENMKHEQTGKLSRVG
jgi:chromosome partitioning protein